MRLSLRTMVTFTALGLASTVVGGIALAGQPDPIVEPVPSPSHTPHGFVQIIGESLSEVTLRPDQESAVEALGAHIEPLQAKVDEAEDELLLALSEQVRDGTIHRQTLEPQVTAYVDARQEVSGELRAALEQLHDLLDPTQREDLADAIESRVHAVRRAILAGQKLNSLAAALDLTDAQKQTIAEGLAQLAPALEHERVAIHQAIEAFRGETFSIEDFLPVSKVPVRAQKRAERIIDLTEAIAAVLDASQREKLADRIRAVATGHADDLTGEAARVPGHHYKDEVVGEAEQDIWAAGGVRRGPWGGVRGGFVVGGAPGFAYRRAAAFPYAAGWGYGW
jgi:hypothetical protein